MIRLAEWNSFLVSRSYSASSISARVHWSLSNFATAAILQLFRTSRPAFFERFKHVRSLILQTIRREHPARTTGCIVKDVITWQFRAATVLRVQQRRTEF